MQYWSILVFIHTYLTAPSLLTVNNDSIRLKISTLEHQAGMIPCTIYNGQNMPVKIIPLDGGHRHGEYTIRLSALPDGEYKLRVSDYQTTFRLSRH